MAFEVIAKPEGCSTLVAFVSERLLKVVAMDA
jgi:hypothetical protein